jgi:hypothetical protein
VILDGDTQGTARDWRARSPVDYDGPRVQAATNPDNSSDRSKSTAPAPMWS